MYYDILAQMFKYFQKNQDFKKQCNLILDFDEINLKLELFFPDPF